MHQKCLFKEKQRQRDCRAKAVYPMFALPCIASYSECYYIMHFDTWFVLCSLSLAKCSICIYLVLPKIVSYLMAAGGPCNFKNPKNKTKKPLDDHSRNSTTVRLIWHSTKWTIMFKVNANLYFPEFQAMRQHSWLKANQTKESVTDTC